MYGKKGNQQTPDNDFFGAKKKPVSNLYSGNQKSPPLFNNQQQNSPPALTGNSFFNKRVEKEKEDEKPEQPVKTQVWQPMAQKKPIKNDPYDYEIGESGSFKMGASISGSGNQFFDPLGLATKPAVDKFDKPTNNDDLTNLSSLPNPLLSKPKPATNNAAAASGWDDDDWNFDDIDKTAEKNKNQGEEINIQDKDYQKKNLNKLSTYELAKEKQKMDVGFNKNQVKPGDPGYVYDKVVDFSKQPKEDNSWD